MPQRAKKADLVLRAEVSLQVLAAKHLHLGAGFDRIECGEMAEWSIAAVLKTVERKFRGFESLSLRQSRSEKSPPLIESAVGSLAFAASTCGSCWCEIQL
jgi:hypothetical protein